MPENYVPSDPSSEEVELQLVESGITLRNWTRYTFKSEYLTPSDGFSFTVGDSDLDFDTQGPLRIGSHVRLLLNGVVQADGYIDSVDVGAERDSGFELTIEGRDGFGHVCDTIADPTVQFKEGATLDQIIREILGPFGWPNEGDYAIDNEANRDAKAGLRGIRRSKGKKTFGKPLKGRVEHQLKPLNREGTFKFLSRITQRHGLWPKVSADGETVIVSRPDFTQEPSGQLRRNRSGTTNVLGGRVHFSALDQPNLIVADGFGAGGEFGHGQLRTIASNPAFYTDDPAYRKPFAKYTDAKRLTDFVAVGTPIHLPRNRTLYLHDDESTTQEQLDNFVRREMSLLLRKSLAASYVVEGHGQLFNGFFVPWDIDTTVEVEDTIAGLTETLWVAGRTFERSRAAGAVTKLDLIRLNSIQFGEEGLAPGPAAKVGEAVPKEQPRAARPELLVDRSR
jgi:prophage tail gpP-like protein